MRRARWLVLLTLGLPCAAAAQVDRSGRYTVEGHEEGWGDHLGWVTLRTTGAGTWTVRGALEFPATGARGAISGQARDGGQGGMLAELTLTLTGPGTGGTSINAALQGEPGPRAGSRREVRVGRTRLQASDDQVRLRARWDPAGAAAGEHGRSGRETWTREARPGTAILELMTFNVKGFTKDWFSREGRVAAVIKAEQPDVVALQEVMGVRRTHSLQASRLARRAGGYHYAFQGARAYTPLKLLWMGNAILSKGKLEDGSRLQLTQGPGSLGTFPRAVTHARIEVRPGAWLHVFSTHLHHKGGKESDAVRVTQARELLQFMRRHRPGPLVLMGDLNADPEDPCVRNLLGAGLRDAFAEANPGDQRGTNSNGKRRIDYVMVDEPERPAISGVRVLGAWLHGPNTERGEMVSDHHAVVVSAELRLPR